MRLGKGTLLSSKFARTTKKYLLVSAKPCMTGQFQKQESMESKEGDWLAMKTTEAATTNAKKCQGQQDANLTSNIASWTIVEVTVLLSLKK